MACDRTRYKRLVLGRVKYKRNRLGRGVGGWGSSKSWDIRVKFWGKLGHKQKYMYFDGKPSKKGWEDSVCKSMQSIVQFSACGGLYSNIRKFIQSIFSDQFVFLLHENK